MVTRILAPTLAFLAVLATPAAAASLSPTSIDVGRQALNTLQTRPVVFTNDGTEDLRVATFLGVDFTLPPGPSEETSSSTPGRVTA